MTSTIIVMGAVAVGFAIIDKIDKSFNNGNPTTTAGVIAQTILITLFGIPLLNVVLNITRTVFIGF